MMCAPCLAFPLPRFTNILFATDFSFCSQAALPYACTIARKFEATLHVVHVLTAEEQIEVPSRIPKAQRDNHEALARRALADLIDASPIHEIHHVASTHRGAVPAVISHLVSERGIDLIVLGTHGYHGLKYFVLGSTAEHVLRHASCPVLTVGPGAARRGAGASFAKILLATDFSPVTLRALSHALAIALAHNSTLILFHAIICELTETEEESLAYLENATADATQQLYNLVPKDIPVSCEVLLRHGAPTEVTRADMIIQTATERKIDLVVMGMPSNVPAVDAAPRSTVHSVLCNITCPVMTVRDLCG